MEEKDYQKFMQVAIEEAENSLKEGNKGFGAVLVKNDRIIERAHDTEVTDSDPTAHAEMNAIRKAFKNYSTNLSGCTLISTHEPCPMCTTALIWAKVPEIVYGASIEDTIKLGRTMVRVSCKDIIKASPRKIKVKGGILNEDCLKLYREDVRKSVEEFKAVKNDEDWKAIERELIEKRDRWFEENKKSLKLKGTDVENAYRLILMKIGIRLSEAPIMSKTKNRIVFRSKNFCPALEACNILRLDTKNVCKAVFERPTDGLIKKINPHLKFTRNYSKIRPYANYCEEIIELIDPAKE